MSLFKNLILLFLGVLFYTSPVLASTEDCLKNIRSKSGIIQKGLTNKGNHILFECAYSSPFLYITITNLDDPRNEVKITHARKDVKGYPLKTITEHARSDSSIVIAVNGFKFKNEGSENGDYTTGPTGTVHSDGSIIGVSNDPSKEAVLGFSKRTSKGTKAKLFDGNIGEVVKEPYTYNVDNTTTSIIKKSIQYNKDFEYRTSSVGIGSYAGKNVMVILSANNQMSTTTDHYNIFKEFGITDAIRLDGNSATSLYVYGSHINPLIKLKDIFRFGSARPIMYSLTVSRSELPKPEVSIGDNVNITEGNTGETNLSFDITLNQQDLDDDVSVVVETFDKTATAGVDYKKTKKLITFKKGPGLRTKKFEVPIIGDTKFEGDETFGVLLHDATGADIDPSHNQAIGTIIDDDTADTIPPVITLNGSNPITINQGATFTDLGATALDDVDGSVTVRSSGTVDASTVGVHKITYTAQDSAGNSASVERTVNVIELVVLPAINSITPATTPVQATIAQNFLVTGQNLTDNITMQLDDCPSPELQAGGSEVQRIFRCAPLSTGTKAGTVTDGSIQKSFTINVEPKPDTVATGSITSPLVGSIHTTEQIDISINVEDVDGLKKVSLVFKQNGTPYVVCEDGTANECIGTSLTKTVTVNLADYGATEGAVNVGLWVQDDGGESVLVDSVGINWTQTATYDGTPLLVVKVEYSDVQGFVASDTEWSDRVFSTGSASTVNDYFLENSKGGFKYAPAHDSNGIATDGVVKVVLNIPHPRGNTIASYTNGAYLETINKALLQLSAEIDFSQFNTRDIIGNAITGDELSILFVISGNDARHVDNPATWPHAIACCSQQVSGVSISSNIAVVGEKRNSFSTGLFPITIGSIVHELGHATFDLPDLYARYYNNSKDNDPAGGIGIMGLMGAGDDGGDNHSGEKPSHLSAWSKIKAGFVQPTIVSNDGTYTLKDTASSEYNILKIPTSRANEYFLLENRSVNGFDSGMQKESFKQGSECYNGSGCEYKGGILIWRIDEACPNNDYSNECLKVEPLAPNYNERGRYSQGWGNGDNFFHSGNMTAANTNSVPSTKFFDGQSSGISIIVNDPPGGSMNIIIDVP